MVAQPNYGLSTDTTLGGNSPSDIISPSEKAIKTYVDSHGSGAAWGGITGNLPNQEDLQGALDEKQNKLTARKNITIEEVEGGNWTQPTLTISIGEAENGIAYGNGIYVTIGTFNYISTSTDGITWTEASYDDGLGYAGTDGYWCDITFGNGKFVAIGASGYTCTSETGTAWNNAVESLDDHSWVAITYGNNKFVVIGADGYISTSTDGETWTTPVEVSNLGSHGWSNIAYGNGKFVAIGRDGLDSKTYKSVSTDGTTWTGATQLTNISPEFLVFDGSKFVMVGENSYTTTSTDGINWTTPTQDSTLAGIVWSCATLGDGKVVAMGENWGDFTGPYISSYNVPGTYISAGASWGDITGTLSDQTDLQTAFDGKQATLVSGTNIKTINNDSLLGSGNINITGLPTQAGNNGKFLTTDGSTASWATVDTDVSWGDITGTLSSQEDLQEVLGDKQDKLTAGKNITIEEVEGGWSQAVEISNLRPSSSWYAIAYGNGTYVVIDAYNYFSTSTDGVTWTLATSEDGHGLDYASSSGYWQAAAYGNGKFVALGGIGYTSTSTNGSTWTDADQKSSLELGEDGNYWYDITHDGTKFVAISRYGYISTSTDGTTWTAAAQYINLGNHDWRSITYGSGKLVAIGGSGYISTSTDGITWTQAIQVANLTYSNDYLWRTIVFDGTQFIAVREDGYVSTSTDGTTWTLAVQVSNLGSHYWTCAVLGDGKVVTLGISGYVANYRVSGVFISATGSWGDITGTLSDQTDLQTALDGKQATISDLSDIRSNAESGAAAATTISDYGDIVSHDANEFAEASHTHTMSEITDLPTIPTVNDTEIEIQKNGTKVDSFTTNQSGNKKTINITVPVTASDVSALPSSTKYGASIDLSINSDTYVVTATLKDQDGTTLNSDTIDLPLETMVVSGSYDSTNKKVVLTLKNGETVEFSVADLVSGLQSEITSDNKLSADLISDGTTNKTVTATEKSTWSGKQDAISDLSSIRSNAEYGASAAAIISNYGDIVAHNANEFAAVDHTHSEYLTEVGWSDIEDKPSTFTPEAHNQASSTITSLTSYDKSATGATGALSTSDSLNKALAKLENALDGKQASGSYAAADHTHSNYVTNTTTVNSKALSSNVTLAGGDIAITSYSKPSSTSALVATDTVNAALGKLEKALDGKQATIANIGDIVTHDADEFAAANHTHSEYLTSSSTLDATKLSGTIPSGCYTDTTYSEFVKSGSGAAAGLVPAPSTTEGSSKYLCEDGTWATPAGTYVHPTTAGSKHIPAGGSAGKILKWSADGTATWETEYSYTHPTSSGNKHIPSGGSSNQVLVYSADGTAAWGAVPSHTHSDYASISHSHVGTEVTLTGYEKASSASAVAATDTVNAAIGKIEKALDGKQASGNYVPTSRKVNNKALSADITLSASDVGALPDSTVIPTITDTYSSTSSNGMSGKAVASAISNKADSATSLSGYGITDAYTKTEIDGKLSAGMHYKGTKTSASALPTTGNQTGDLWNVSDTGANYAWNGSEWDKLSENVDLSGYVPTSRTINSKALTGNITLNASDVGAAASSHTHDTFVKSGSGAAAGMVPAPSTTAGTTKYLCENGEWGTPAGTYTHPTTSGNKHIPSGGSSGKILKWSADGTATWETEYSYTHPTTSGNKHIPSGGSSGKILKWSSDGTATWETEYSYAHPTTSGNKHIPSGGSSNQVLVYSADGTAAWGAVPSHTHSGYAASTHSHVGTEVTLTGYEKASSASAVAATDSVNAAIGKLEKALDGKQASGNYVPTSRTVNSKALSSNITLSGADVAVTGYSKASSASAIAATDTVNAALGKLEKALDGKQASGNYVSHTASTAVGSATQGVYIASNGTATAMTYSLNKTVPSDAVFTDTVYTHPTTSGNKHIPSGGSSGQFLKWSADGTATWAADNNNAVTNTLGTTTKAYITGTTSATTNTGGQTFDTGVYLTTTAGKLNATSMSLGSENVSMAYNSTTKSIDFTFA